MSEFLRLIARPSLAVGALALITMLSACSPASPTTSETQSASPAAFGDQPPSANSSPKQEDQQDQSAMKTVHVRVFNSAGELVGPVESPRVEKTDAQWKAQLTPEQYQIARNKGTERAFCGTLLDNKKDGVYACVCCGLPLFSSSDKFNSGTGWPSFFQPVAKENVIEHEDRSHGMSRTEILCARCDCHLGHVFDDGPRPTGLRFCVNSESLVFTPVEDVKKLADPAAESAKRQASSNDQSASAQGKTARAVFAGGCFWCVEAVFEELEGVKEVISGYAGGSKGKETANYEAVCTGRTGHAEAVEIVYDPAKISYEELLRVHFATHDPTSLNQQGNDFGTQYRSAIFYENDEQKKIAEAFIADLNDAKVYGKPIVTTLEPLKPGGFYAAETYHQNYVCNNPNASYVRGVALPKVDKVRKEFKDALKATSPLQK
jgi:peptide methionine sulfoxide reductase msrA/msrB